MCETGKLFFEEAGIKMYLSRGEEEKYFFTVTGEDGKTVYCDWIHVNRLMKKLRSLDHGTKAEFRHPTFFSRVSRYSCRVDINGIEYQTTWEPARPDTITVLKYHHYAEIHLTEKQIREFWEKTDANPESNPIGRPKTWTSKL